MAEPAAAGMVELTPLSCVRPEFLEPVLSEEILEWRQRLCWDLAGSADLVRHYIESKILQGFALSSGGQALGYSYYVVDDRKGLIGDLYLRHGWRNAANELRLLVAVLDSIMRSPDVRRIESQLMMLESSRAALLRHPEHAQAYLRSFMLADLDAAEELPVGKAAERVFLQTWKERFHDEAAHVIEAAYLGHIDSQINDQYCTVAGARRFLHNIVEYPGCGNFFEAASFAAFERDSALACGMSLASLVASDIGHITQICVLPRVQGTGIGYELLRRSMVMLRRHGCRKVSLTVTAANTDAVRLYERVGFRVAHRFDALVWSGFQERREAPPISRTGK